MSILILQSHACHRIGQDAHVLPVPKAAVRCAPIAVVLAIGWVAGCGKAKQGPEQAPVRGVVKLNNEPMPEGTINFMSIAEGRNASAVIQAGQYDIPEERGPNLGKYRVEIFWYRQLGEAPEDNPDGPGGRVEQLIPSRYNTQSTLEAEIESGPNEHDFDLTTDRPRP